MYEDKPMVIYMYEKSLYPVFPSPSDCTVYMVMTEPGIKFEDELTPAKMA